MVSAVWLCLCVVLGGVVVAACWAHSFRNGRWTAAAEEILRCVAARGGKRACVVEPLAFGAFSCRTVIKQLACPHRRGDSSLFFQSQKLREQRKKI